MSILFFEFKHIYRVYNLFIVYVTFHDNGELNLWGKSVKIVDKLFADGGITGGMRQIRADVRQNGADR